MTRFVFTNDIFFRNLAYLRAEYCLSRRALAKLCHISPLWIRDMEAGIWRKDLDVEVLVRLSQIFQVELHALLTEDLGKQKPEG